MGNTAVPEPDRINSYIQGKIDEAAAVMRERHPEETNERCLVNLAFRGGDDEHCMLDEWSETILPVLVATGCKPVASFAFSPGDSDEMRELIESIEYVDDLVRTTIFLNHWGMEILLLYTDPRITHELLEGLANDNLMDYADENPYWKIGALYGYNNRLEELLVEQ